MASVDTKSMAAFPSVWTSFADHENLRPVRDELFGAEHLETHARSLGKLMTLTVVEAGQPLPEAFARNARKLRDAHRVIAEAYRNGEPLGNDAEWLLDNYHIISDALTEIRTDLPVGYYQRLPKLPAGPLAGYPRVYALALDLTAHCDSGLEESGIIRFVQAFQELAPLTVGEIWAIPIMLRLCLIENLRRLAQHIVHFRSHRQQAQNWIAKKLSTLNDRPEGQAFDLGAIHCDWRDCYVMHLLEGLHDHAAIHPEGLERLEKSLAAAKDSPADVLRREKERQAANQVSIGNCVTTLRLLSALDWTEFFEKTSRLEAALRRDPAGIYARQDFATRDRYRAIVEKLAYHSRTSERAVAEMILQLASDADGNDPRRRHIGHYLIGEGAPPLEAELRYRPPITDALRRTLSAYPRASYFGALGLIVPMALAALAWASHSVGAGPGLGLVLVLAALIPVTGMAVELVNCLVAALMTPRLLPALELKAGVPRDCATFIVIPSLLTSPSGTVSLIERLEIHYLANSENNVYFALLTDFADAPAEQMPEDEGLLRAASEGICNLNEKYAEVGRPLFFLLHRRRQWNQTQGCWMGWERKRGKLSEFNRLLRGAQDTSFVTVGSNWATLPRIRFVITLDADTQLPRDSARRLIAMMAHPLNQPELDATRQLVVRGYAILQPRIGFALRAARGSLFARLFSDAAGLDPYTSAVSDTYQDLFGSGSFTGKGIYDVDAFEATVGNVFPDNHILSHDLIEGNYARCGLVTNVELLDDFPANYLAYLRRAHRWVRGDWQIMAWLFRWVPGPGGAKIRNPLPLLQRWKIFDNLRRSLMPFGLVAMLGLGWTVLPGSSWGWTAFAILILANPLLFQVLNMLGGCLESLVRGKPASLPLGDLGFTAGQIALAAVFLAAEAFSSLDAIGRTLCRLWFTKHNLLEWETAASTERRLGNGLTDFWRVMWPATAFALVLALLVAWWRPEAILPASPLLLGWMLSPLIAFLVSQPKKNTQSSLTPDDEQELRRLARKTWSFFETFVGPEDHWLPPDNYQEDPKNEVAHRTSPTNIGLYLLSCVAAHDFGYVTITGMIDRLEKTMATLKTMERSHGHFYNWYNTQKLEPLQPRYLSTVDSGNLVACLLTLKQSLLEKIHAPIVDAAATNGIRDVALLLRESIRALEDPAEGDGNEIGAAFEPLLQAVLSSLDSPAGDVAEWSARLSRVDAEQTKLDAQAEHLNALLAEAPQDVRRWSAALAELVRARQRELGGIKQSFKESHRPLDRLTLAQLADEHTQADASANGSLHVERPKWADDLVNRCEALAEQADELAAAMDFKILYNGQRHLFAVGYNQSLGKLDSSHYDLLASEASLTSFLAIARREAPRKHWFHLGRPLTEAAGNRVLVSWGGTMFEYLMPRLLLPIEPATLLGESQAGAVAAQIAYARQCGTPWGISESAFSAVDAQLNYQYQAFGAPALGLKRGLGKDLVIAPYATGLAFMVAPRQALVNLRQLDKEGAEGAYGWYESIDYTAERLPKGERRALVKCHMAHHQGMTLLALANCLLENPMPRRFRAEPMVRATELLLQERVPGAVPLSELQPQDAGHTTFHEIPTQLSRRVTTPHTAMPRTHILASAQCFVMVTAAGSGFSSARGLAITRWREDTACDLFGQFYYLRDLSTGRSWSAGYQPLARDAEVYEVTFNADKVEFRRRDGQIETRMEITIAPDHHAEIRRLSIFNHDDRPHDVEVTSYVEIVLLPQAADLAHPAFGKLFLETEMAPGGAALLCRRRPRSPEQKPIWCVHVLAADGRTVGPMQYETDRARFLGRGRTPAAPAALDPGSAPLSGAVGAVLDPILSLRGCFRIAAGASAQVAFTTALADSREDALALADAGKDLHSVHRAFELAWAHTQVELRQQHWTAAETHVFQRLAAHVIFAGTALREAPALVAKNRQGQTDLWRLGLSGDLPMVLVRIAAAAELALVRQVLAAHTFWRLKGLAVDLVILNEEGGTYFEELDQQLQLLVRASDDRTHVDQPGGVYFRKRAHLSQADLLLLQATARCALVASRGLLAVQLDRLERVRTVGAATNARRRASTKIAAHSSMPIADLAFDNGLGGFSTDGKEYVLRLRDDNGRHVLPPQPWVNVIANRTFGTIVSETGGGFTWADNSQSNRLTPWRNDPVSDPPGEVVYLRDDASEDFWSATPLPCGNGAPFIVRHGHGYSTFEHACDQISCRLTVYVAPEDPVKFFKLTVRNLGPRTRRLSAIFYADLVLGTHRSRTAPHVVLEIDAETEALLARNSWDADFKDKIAFADVNQRPRQVSADRTEFIGRNGTLTSPAGCVRGQLAGAVGACLDPCAALQTTFVLGPQEEKEIIFVLGETDSVEKARRLVRLARDPSQMQSQWNAAIGFWEQFTTGLTIRTPDAALDRLVNRWLTYQILSCRMWARSALYQSGGAYGFRDQLQDSLALVYARPEETRQHLLRAAARQFVEGDVQHWWHVPSGAGVRTRISDDFLWLPFAVRHYVLTTGDWAVLDEKVEFLQAPPLADKQEEDYRIPTNSGEAGTIYEHCLRAIKHGFRYGVHGLPLMGTGDWNDGMNRVGAAGRGESVWLGWFLLTVFQQFAEVCDHRGNGDHAKAFRDEAERLRQHLEENAWDGQWYRRAYFDDGQPLGSAQNNACRIDSLPQSWAVISGAADSTRARAAMEAVHAELVRSSEKLVLLFTPPFEAGKLEPGYIKGYVPGIRENGGQYTHAALWIAQAWALLGDGDRALEILDLINPILHTESPEEVERYALEPYVIAADVYANALHRGRGGWSWYTGSASWYYRVVIENLLGFELRGQHIRLNPCLPTAWPGAELTYRYRRSLYVIKIERSSAISRSLDGMPWSEELFPLQDDAQNHTIVVTVT